MSPRPHLRYLKTGPEFICLAVMMYVRYPLSLRNMEGLLHRPSQATPHRRADRMAPTLRGLIMLWAGGFQRLFWFV
jgi:hypothetical protein